MSVTFVTVFLGLVLGVQPVELDVGADVARVELLLDGQPVGDRTGPPWEIPCDFGGDLAPHELVAVARDAEGREVGRARQWLNLPRSRAGFAGTTGRTQSDWANASSERLAVAIELNKRRRDLDVQELASHLTVDGRAVEPVTVEKGLADVVVVVDRDAEDDLRRMGGLPPRAPTTGRPISEAPIDDSNPARPRPGDVLSRGGESAAGVLARRQAFLRSAMRLGEGQLVRFLWPRPKEADEGEDETVRPALFRQTRGFPPSHGGMLWFLSRVSPPADAAQEQKEQRLADAVAAAGMAAASSGHRRAVVLVLGEDPSDASGLSPREVRPYLQHLGVPLHVWAVGAVPDEVAEAWGDVRPVPKKRALRRAVKNLSKSLERQRIVWVEGLHLPQKVSVTGVAEDLRLVR